MLLFGASGTIGRATAKALVMTGHTVTCPVRGDVSIDGADIRLADVTDGASLAAAIPIAERFDVAISCLASRSGTPKDAERIDLRANRAALDIAAARGAKQFIYCSAICVQKPRLAFQHAKLAFEAALEASAMRHTIVRPTAFFKSLSGQIERVRRGKPYLLFGDGELTRCKPISDRDLARYIVQCIDNEERVGRILPIGGPGPAISPKEQGLELFRLAGRDPNFRRLPVWVMDGIVDLLAGAARLLPPLTGKAEYAKIGRYYATESMLVWDHQAKRYDADATPEFGSDTLFDHYAEQLGADFEQ